MAVDTNILIKNEIAVWMEVQDYNKVVDITRCDIVYQKNGIPNIPDINIAIGKNVTESTDTTGLGDILTRYKKIKIKFAAREVLNKPESRYTGPGKSEWPPGAYMTAWPPKYGDGIIIFDGYITSSSFRCSKGMQGNDTSYTVSAVHFLNDIAGAPVSSRSYSQKHPLDPSRLMQRQFKSITTPNTLAGSTDQAIINFFSSVNAGQNIWKKGVSALLNDLSKSTGDSDVVADFFSDDAKTSLKNPGWMANGEQDNISLYKLGPTEISKTILATISNDMANNFLQIWWGSNAWTIMTNIVRKYHMAIIPAIGYYAVVPYTPCLGGAAYLKIGADEYDLISVSNTLNLPLRQVALLPNNFTNSYLADDTRNAQNRVPIGLYPPEGIKFEGTRAEARLIEAPSWLATGDAKSTFIPRTDVSEKSASTGKKVIENKTATIDGEVIGNRYAKLEYFLALFNGNNTSISGRLRFDVGPGSLLEVESVLDTSPNAPSTTKSIFGTVESVVLSFAITGAGGGTAKTSFNLSNVRTDKEQADTIKTSATHPLYNTTWKGTPLLENFGKSRS